MTRRRNKPHPALITLCVLFGIIVLAKAAWIIVPVALAGIYGLGRLHGSRSNKAVSRLRAERDSLKARVSGLSAEISRARDIAHAAWNRSAEPEPESERTEDDLVSRLVADPLSGVRRLGSARARHGQSV